ncbi:MAG: polysaccharide pyruvyl transferase family protein [Omnitrophica WOR_2 bacterium]
MRILLDPGVYDMRNKGNVALLQVAVDRIHGMWPQATMEVLTESPHILKLYCPGVKPVNPHGFDGAASGSRTKLVQDLIPRGITRSLLELREALWRRKSSWVSPSLLTASIHPNNGTVELHDDPQDCDNIENILNGAHLFVATGAQYMSDACRNDALKVLDRFEIAARRGIPTAMVGQGFGPIKDQVLLSRSKTVLPQIDLIFVREKTASPQLLASLGVDPSHVFLTGDDAIEMAYKSRQNRQGNGIGVGLRVAEYTEVDSRHIQNMKEGIQKAAQKYGAPLISIPISHSAHELDDKVLQQILSGYGKVSQDWRRFNSPQDIIRKVSRCRLVVAGTFHPIVFALAQGIPAIGLAKSGMYMDKFLGLADLFGDGLQIIRLDDESLEQQIIAAIDRAWNSAGQVRPGLLDAACKQIEMGQAAYQRIFDLVAGKNH